MYKNQKLFNFEHPNSQNEIKIISISPVENRGALKAFVNIQVGPFTIVDCRVVQDSGSKPWVSMPPFLQGRSRHYTLQNPYTNIK